MKNKGQGKKGESQAQRDRIMNLPEYLAGEEFSQASVCERLNVSVSVANARLRDLYQKGVIHRVEVDAGKGIGGVAVLWVRRKSPTAYLSASWRKQSNEQLGIRPTQLGSYP